MILSVSRRTDIPAFYSDWFYERLKAGFLDQRNPFNAHQISRVSLKREDVDCFVFWTKNPKPMMSRLKELEGYDYYFQFTLTPYEKDVEPGLPPKLQVVETFRELSERIGKERVVWRYDPILLSEKYTISYHLKKFEEFADKLEGFTELCVMSFLDLYKKTERNMKPLKLLSMTEEDMHRLAKGIAGIARAHGLVVESCSERIDLSEDGVAHGFCIDRRRIEKVTGWAMDVRKDKNQRAECGCVESTDIGRYNTCRHFCRYCYANFNEKMVRACAEGYDKSSTIFADHLTKTDLLHRKVMAPKHLKLRRLGEAYIQENLF